MDDPLDELPQFLPLILRVRRLREVVTVLVELPLYLPLILAGVLALVLIYRRGDLSPRAFDAIPPRRSVVNFIDLFICLWILMASMMMLGMMLPWLGIAHPGSKPGPTLRETAILPLLSQGMTQLPIVIFILWRAGRIERGLVELGIVPRHPWRELKASLLALIAALPMVMASAAIFTIISRLLNLHAPAVGHEMLEDLLHSKDPTATALLTISAVIVAPVLEEIVFRGLVQSALLDWLGPSRRWLIVLIAAAIFSLIHAGPVSWHALPGLFILGIVLGWLYEKHGSLLPCIVLHMLFNLANIGMGLLSAGAN